MSTPQSNADRERVPDREREGRVPASEVLDSGFDTLDPNTRSILFLQHAIGNEAVGRGLGSAAAFTPGRSVSRPPAVVQRQPRRPGEPDDDRLDGGTATLPGGTLAAPNAGSAGAPAAPPGGRPPPPAGATPPPAPTAPGAPRAGASPPAGPAPSGRSSGPAAPTGGAGGPSPATGARPAGPTGVATPTPDGRPAGLPANAVGNITRNNPSSGIDWAAFFQGTGGNLARSGLEITRLVPGWGLLGGAAADAINIYQDMTAVPYEDAPITEKLVMVRSAVMVINNGIGHITYIAQLAQDGVTVSVVLAPLVPVTASANETLKIIKVSLDGVQFLLDFSIGCAASYNAAKSPPPAQDKWNSFANNYTANVLGDAAAFMFDLIDLSSGGFSNTEVAQQGAKAGKAVFTTAKFIVPAVRQVLQGLFGVFGGNIPFSSGSGAPAAAGASSPPRRNVADLGSPGPAAEAAAEVAAFRVISGELKQIKQMYQLGDSAIDLAAGAVKLQVDQMNRMAKQFLGGKDPFITFRDTTRKGLDDMRKHIGQLGQMQFFATSGKEKAAAVRTSATEAIAKLDGIVVPPISIPKAELGDGALAQAGAAVLNLGGSVANAGIEATMRQLKDVVNQAKSTLRSPLERVKDNSNEIGEFLQVVDQQATIRIAQLNEKVAVFSEKLGKCQNIEQVIDLIIAQVMEAAGIQGEIKVEDIRQLWRSAGPEIDAAIAWADGRAAAATRRMNGRTSPGEPGPEPAPRAATPPPPSAPPGGGASPPTG